MTRRLLIVALALALIGAFSQSRPTTALAVGCGGAPADLGSAQSDARELWRVTASDHGAFLTTLVSDDTIVLSETTGGCLLSITALRGIDTATGKDRWVAPSEQFGRIDNGPVGIADAVYLVSSATSGTPTPGRWLVALDAATGTTRWTIGLDDGDPWFYQVAGGDADTVILTAGGNDGAQILAVEAATGAIRWSVPMTGFVRSIAFDAATGSVYAVNGSVGGIDQAARFDPATGDLAWLIPVPGATADAASTIVTARETGIVVSVQGQLSFLAAADGATTWEDTASTGLGDSPSIQYWTTDDALIESVTGPQSSVLTAYQLTDGTELWTTDLSGIVGDPFGPSGEITASGTLLVGSSTDSQYRLDGVAALDLTTGETTWSASIPATSNFSSSTDAVYVADNDGGSGHLHALNAADGTELWTLAFPDLSALRIVATADGVVYVDGETATDVTLVAVNV